MASFVHNICSTNTDRISQQLGRCPRRPLTCSAPPSPQPQPDDMAPPTMPGAQPNRFGFRDPGSIKADILMSIKEEHINNISTGRKNHEYRKYLLPASVKHIWFYTSAPVASIQYVARIGRGRKPGEVPEDGGIGNEDFNAGRKVSKFGYEIKRLYRLRKPITLRHALSEGYLKGPPQKYCWAPASLLDAYPLKNQECIITRREGKSGAKFGTGGVLGKRRRGDVDGRDEDKEKDQLKNDDVPTES